MNSQSAIMYIRAYEDLHPGNGMSSGLVDLPVQREVATKWPMIQGSSIKGVLRDKIRGDVLKRIAAASDFVDKEAKKRIYEKADADDALVTLFGESGNGGDRPKGSISISDAKILFFPVRSFKGVYALITCPAVLRRYADDLEFMQNDSLSETINKALDNLDANAVANKKVVLTQDSILEYCHANFKAVVFEEFKMDIVNLKENGARPPLGIEKMFSSNSKCWDRYLKEHAAIVCDEVFTFFVNYAAMIQTRIALDSRTKNVEDGALFYEEFLPTGTIMYSVIDTENRSNTTPESLMSSFYEKFNDEWVQIGGDETVGKGRCKLHIDRFSAEASEGGNND